MLRHERNIGDFSDWKNQQDYQKAFAAADERYAKILSALLARLKPTS